MSDSLRAGVLLDVDGTLLDTNYLHTLAWWQALRDTGHDGVSMAQVHRAVGIASAGLVERLLGEVDDRTVERHGELYAEHRDRVEAFPDVPELVAALGRRDLVVVLATSGKEDDLEWMLPAIGAGDDVDGVTTSSEVEAGKPAPDLLEAAISQHRLDRQRTVLVGDTVWDVQAADRAGIPCIGVTCGGISEADLRESGAVEVYDGPSDLLAGLAGSLLARL